ncbi:hypothetical protein BG011_006423 [Mortierella polycephala]|uniref:PWI domain-containing protein n=1 Tax=Mortierella polycephala TaxID=41804 RepID=A0A9P6PTK9_9FUNG|nr:hypothetical protein BG011_006423 [Mortierella polycephala]
MGDAGFFKGTSADQDTRFSDKQKKLLRSMNFPPEFNQKIDMKKVNLKVIKGWMAQRVNQLLGIEDEVVVEYAFGMLEEPSPDPKTMQINLQGFLDKNSQVFVLELWKLLLSAQNSLGGIPQQFLDHTKEELLQRKRDKEAELAKVREQEEKDRAVVEQVKRKAQEIRESTRPKALAIGNEAVIAETIKEELGATALEAKKDTIAEGVMEEDTRVRDRIDTRIEEGTAAKAIDRTTVTEVQGAVPAVALAAVAMVVVVVVAVAVTVSEITAGIEAERVVRNIPEGTEAKIVDASEDVRMDVTATVHPHQNGDVCGLSGSRSRSDDRSRIKAAYPTRSRSRTPPAQSKSTNGTDNKDSPTPKSEESGTDVKPKDSVDTVALENQLREKLLRERVLQSVKNKNANQES